MTINVETDQAANSELDALRQRLIALEQRLAERECAEAELRASEARFRLLAENSVDLLSRHAPDGAYLYVSPACETILGYTPAEMIGRSAYELLHPDDLAKTRTAHAEALKDSDRTSGSYRCRHKAGHYIWLETTYRTQRDPQTGAVQEIYCVGRDITARKRDETALLASEQKLSLHVQQTPLAYIEWNAAFEVVEWNPAAERIFGYSRDEAIGRHGVGLLVAESARVPLEQAWQSLLQQRDAQRSIYTNVTNAGTTIRGEWYNTPLIDPSGQVLGVVSLVQDISEREQTEAALRASEERLNSIMRTLDDVLWSVDATTSQLVYLSDAAERVYGYPIAQLRANPRLLLDVVHPDDRAQYNQYTPQLLEHGSIDVQYRLKRPDGSVRLVHDRGWLVRDDRGRAVTINGIVSDITSRAEAEAESQRLQAEVIEMQQAMLAELSTPLIPINDHVVVMPLIGALDSQRVQRVLDTLLNGVISSRARTAILDITGVPVVDTQIANVLIRAAQAVKLLGANVVLTGIRPEVAQTLVGLGVDLGQIVTRSSLQSGIAYASGR